MTFDLAYERKEMNSNSKLFRSEAFVIKDFYISSIIGVDNLITRNKTVLLYSESMVSPTAICWYAGLKLTESKSSPKDE